MVKIGIKIMKTAHSMVVSACELVSFLDIPVVALLKLVNSNVCTARNGFRQQNMLLCIEILLKCRTSLHS